MVTKKIKYYAYDRETGRYLSPAKLASGDYFDYVVSRIPPKQRKERQESFENWSNSKATGDYQDTVIWGSQGGRPRQYANQAVRQKAYRSRQTSGYSHDQPRPGAYKYHTDQASSSAERVRRYRLKKKLLITGGD